MTLKAKYLHFIYRLIKLKITVGARFYRDDWAVGLEPGSKVIVDKRSHISVATRVYLMSGATIEAYDGGRLSIGARSFINRNSAIVARTEIRIGQDCLVGDGVGIYDHNHAVGDTSKPIRDQGYVGKPIRIGNNVWIGRQAFIGAGVTIGDNVVIGAHAIVTKDIPANTIAHCQVKLTMRPRSDVDATASRPAAE